MTLAELSLKRPVTVIMLFVSMTVIGLIAAFRLPLEELPDIAFPFMLVNLPYPGSTPTEVERTITRPVEEALSTMTDIKNMIPCLAPMVPRFSCSSNGARTRRSRPSRRAARSMRFVVTCLADLTRYQVQKFSPADEAVLKLRISSDHDLTNSYELLDRKIKRPLERLPGVARVEIQGVAPREVQIEISSDRLTAAGIGLNDLYQKLSAANFSTSGGLVKDGDLRYHVQPLGEWRSVEDIGAMAVNDKGLKLSDVANVTLKPARLDYERHLDLRPQSRSNIQGTQCESGRNRTQCAC